MSKCIFEKLLIESGLKFKEEGNFVNCFGYSSYDDYELWTKHGYFSYRTLKTYKSESVFGTGRTDTIFIYNFVYDFYLIYEFSSGFNNSPASFVAVDGTGNKTFDVRNYSPSIISVSMERFDWLLRDLNAIILSKTRRQADLWRSLSQFRAFMGYRNATNEVSYDSYLLKRYSEKFDEFRNLMIKYKDNLKFLKPMSLDAKNIDEILNTDDLEKFKSLHLPLHIYLNGEPLLIPIIRCECVKIFDYLLKEKCDVNVVSAISGEVPLHCAVYQKNYRHFVDELIKAGADINKRDFEGQNLLYHAIITRKEDVFDYVYQLKGIQKDIKVEEIKDSFGIRQTNGEIGKHCFKNLIQCASLELFNYGLEVLLKEGSPNDFLEDTYPPLVMALLTDATGDRYEVVETLLKHNANTMWSGEVNYRQVSIDECLNQVNDYRLTELINKYRK